MGNAFGSVMGKISPSQVANGPNMNTWPNFDPNYGFENGRKERVMKVTEEEMISAKIPVDQRDYCAHHLIEYGICRRDQFPLFYRCAPEKHKLFNCQYEDYLIRAKEYERERRLLERARRIERRAKRELLAA